ncbi:hypothetical protein [Clostridium sp. DL1XJH146]
MLNDIFENISFVKLITIILIYIILIAFLVPIGISIISSSTYKSCLINREQILYQYYLLQLEGEINELDYSFINDTENNYFENPVVCPGNGDYLIFKDSLGQYKIYCTKHDNYVIVNNNEKDYQYNFTDITYGDLAKESYFISNDLSLNKNSDFLSFKNGEIYFQNENTQYSFSSKINLKSIKNELNFIFDAEFSSKKLITGYSVELSNNNDLSQIIINKIEKSIFGYKKSIIKKYNLEDIIWDYNENNWYSNAHDINILINRIDDNSMGIIIYLDNKCITSASSPIEIDSKEELYGNQKYFGFSMSNKSNNYCEIYETKIVPIK